MDVNVSALFDWFNVMANGRFSQPSSYIYEYVLYLNVLIAILPYFTRFSIRKQP